MLLPSRYLWLSITVYSITTVYIPGGNEYGISGHLHIFAFLKHLIMLLRCKFSVLHLYTLSQTHGSMQGHAAQNFLKWKTLLNNAFNVLIVIEKWLFQNLREGNRSNKVPQRSYFVSSFCQLIINPILHTLLGFDDKILCDSAFGSCMLSETSNTLKENTWDLFEDKI